MCHYTHLTPFEREKILFFLAEGKSITEIAHLLDRSKSTISRELHRNAAPADQPMSYCPLTAQALYKRRRKACRPHKRLEYAPLHSYIQICILEYHWSPEEIVGRIKEMFDGIYSKCFCGLQVVGLEGNLPNIQQCCN